MKMQEVDKDEMMFMVTVFLQEEQYMLVFLF